MTQTLMETNLRKTNMDKEIFLRQLDIVDPDKLGVKIAIIGGGSIGGWAALCLGKLGCSDITVFDFDEVEKHNAGPQIYNSLDAGMLKVDALKLKIDMMIEGEIKVKNVKWTPEIDLEEFDIVIAAVDNITDRKTIFEEIMGYDTLYIDGRMAANNIEIYTTRMNEKDDINFYGSTLFDEKDTIELPCSARSVVYNVFIIAGMMGDIVAKYVNGVVTPRIIEIDLNNFTLFK